MHFLNHSRPGMIVTSLLSSQDHWLYETLTYTNLLLSWFASLTRLRLHRSGGKLVSLLNTIDPTFMGGHLNPLGTFLKLWPRYSIFYSLQMWFVICWTFWHRDNNFCDKFVILGSNNAENDSLIKNG